MEEEEEEEETGTRAGNSVRNRNNYIPQHGNTIRVRATAGASSSSTAAAAAPLEPSLCVMSVVEEGSNISFCCYNEEQNEIMTETCTATGYETEALVGRFLQVARPNMVLVG